MGNFKQVFNKVVDWVKTHVWQSAVIGVAFVTVVVLSIVLPIALSGNNNGGNKVTVESIKVKTMPTKVIYEYNEDFDSTGIVVALKNSDGSESDLANEDYTIDTSKFNKTKAGIYEITVSYNASDDKTTSFNVKVNEPSLLGISANTDYDNKFRVFEEFDITKINLVITKTYSDGSSVQISGDALANYNNDVDLTNAGIDKTATIEIDDKSCNITYTVFSEDDLTIASLSVIGKPFTSSLVLDDKNNVQDYCNALSFEVEYDELPGKKYTLALNQVTPDYGAIYSAVAPGQYDARFTYRSSNVAVSFNLVDLTGYEIYDFIFDYSNVPTLFYVGEEINSDVLTNVTIKVIYSKKGSPNVTLPYTPINVITTDKKNYTDTSGTPTVWIMDNGQIVSTKCCYSINVVEFTLPDGEYLRNRSGAYEKYFKVENSEFSFYKNGKYVSGYEVVDFFRYKQEDVSFVQVSLSNGDNTEYITLNTDGTLYNMKKLEDTDAEVKLHILSQEMTYFFADGKISDEMFEQMKDYGDTHFGSPKGELINLKDYTFSNGDEIYFVYQQDATGQPFLGNYVSSEPDGYYIVVNADGVDIYNSKEDYTNKKNPVLHYEYKFVTVGNTVTVTLISNQVGTIDLSNMHLSIIGMSFVLEK